jgi:hypothetical protein
MSTKKSMTTAAGRPVYSCQRDGQTRFDGNEGYCY